MIYNIPFCESFLDVFCEKIIKDNKNKEENLANYLILLPNKRIIKNLQTTFLKHSNAKVLILPKMISIYDLDYVIYNTPTNFINNSSYLLEDIIKPTISKRERSFILAKLIAKMDTSLSSMQSILLAKDLGNLIDRSYWENVDFSKIDDLIDYDLAIHWQEILKFLSIAYRYWPEIIKDEKSIDKSYQQNLIFKLQNKIWQNSPPTSHVVSLNIASFHIDIINLLQTISNLPMGDLYFYGVDFNMDESIFNSLEYTHPQKIYSFIFNKLQLKRENITKLYSHNSNENIVHRLFDKLIPKNLDKQQVDDFTSRFTIINTRNEEEEARTISLCLRETLETEEKTAAVITNNKNLITRIINDLKKWNVEIDDYLGESLSNSIQAQFFILVSNVLKNNFTPTDFLSLLNHPFCCFGLNRSNVIKNAKNLDLYLFRNPLYQKDISYYKQAIGKLDFVPDKIKYSLIAFLSHIEQQIPEFFELIKNNNKRIDFQQLLITHIRIAENITKEYKQEDNNLWKEQEGKELSIILSTLLEESKHLEPINIDEYLDIIKSAIQETNIRKIYNKHPRIYIYGDIQSSLIHHDTIIIANMNEGSMPILEKSNPWMSPIIMQKIGFTPDESTIGLKGNIFSQLIGAQEVLITRSEKEGGRLTSASRWLLKLETFFKYYYPYGNSKFINSRGYLYELQKVIDMPQTFSPLEIKNIAFNPPLEHRPTTIAATHFETLIKNPYLYFVDKILKLSPLENIDPDMEEKKYYGTALHKTLEIFFENIQTHKLFDQGEQYLEINKIAEKVFAPFLSSPSFRLFKLPIIKSSLHKLLQEEDLTKINSSYIEKTGCININLKNQQIKIILKGKADRIDILDNGIINIFDYKTSSKRKIEPYWKQLLILSLILSMDGFSPEIPSGIINTINAQYLFLPNKFGEKVLRLNSLETDIISSISSFHKEIEAILNQYYLDLIPYQYNYEDNKIYGHHKHFLRFDEWNTNLTLNYEDQKEQD